MPDAPIVENPGPVQLGSVEERKIDSASVSPSPPLSSQGGAEIPMPVAPVRRLARIVNPVDFRCSLARNQLRM